MLHAPNVAVGRELLPVRKPCLILISGRIDSVLSEAWWRPVNQLPARAFLSTPARRNFFLPTQSPHSPNSTRPPNPATAVISTSTPPRPSSARVRPPAPAPA